MKALPLIHGTRPIAWLVALVGLAGALATAAPLERDELGSVPAAERGAWQEYLDRSGELARVDLAALAAELESGDLEDAIPAPDGGDFKISKDPGDPWFAGEEAGALADIVLSYQTPAGGWSKKTGYSKGARQPGMQWSSQYDPGSSPHYLGTFDNRSTTEQLQFLASVAQATGRDDCREAVLRGIDYVLAAQFPNGGWPQVFPLEGDYHDNITFNDDAMTHVLNLLRELVSDDPRFAFVPEDKRAAAAAALRRGVDCAIRLQVRQDGGPAGWCAQYDPLTLAPAEARGMEPVALGSVESSNLLKLLMKLEDPRPELVAAIEGGLDWLERSILPSDDGKPRWARFYDLADNRPMFPGRDGVIYESFEEMAKHNELGYDYFSSRPSSALGSSQAKWRKMLAKEE